MKSNAVWEHDGKKYISSKAISEIWGLSQKTVAKYCREKKIRDCIKGTHQQWYISETTVKPLSDLEIRRLLFLTLQLKNDPTLEIDWSTFDFDPSLIELIYSNLVEEKYLKPFQIENKQRIPYEVILTQKGLETAMPRKVKTANIAFSETTTQWFSVAIGLAQLAVQIYQVANNIV